jgi:hypothetical protein
VYPAAAGSSGPNGMVSMGWQQPAVRI